MHTLKTYTQQSRKQTELCTHIEPCVPVTKEGEGNRDLLKSRASVVLRDGLGVPAVLTVGVEVLQGHSRVHPGQQGTEAGQKGLQHQQHHGLSHLGMELTASSTVEKEGGAHTPQATSAKGAEQDRTVRSSSHGSWIPPRLCLRLLFY